MVPTFTFESEKVVVFTPNESDGAPSISTTLSKTPLRIEFKFDADILFDNIRYVFQTMIGQRRHSRHCFPCIASPGVREGSRAKHNVGSMSLWISARLESKRFHDVPEEASVPTSLLFCKAEEKEECDSENQVDPLIKPNG